MRPQVPDALAVGQEVSRLGPIVEGQVRGEAAYSQSRPQAGAHDGRLYRGPLGTSLSPQGASIESTGLRTAPPPTFRTCV